MVLGVQGAFRKTQFMFLPTPGAPPELGGLLISFELISLVHHRGSINGNSVKKAPPPIAENILLGGGLSYLTFRRRRKILGI